jgi:hypothetical protein
MQRSYGKSNKYQFASLHFIETKTKKLHTSPGLASPESSCKASKKTGWLGLGFLMSLSTIFQLYHGSQSH